jgi:hypothetical protein
MSPVDVRGNPYHPTRDIAILREPWTADELVEAAGRASKPLSQKATPGTSSHERLLEAGGRIYQQCPPLELDAGTTAVQQWCADHQLLPTETGEEIDLLELFTTWYEVLHTSWSPTAPHDELRDLFRDVADEIDQRRTAICRVRGEIVAAAFVFSDDVPEGILTEALLPAHPLARDAVASCMARTLSDAAGIVRFDGHVSDPHFYPLLQSVPGVYAGANDPLDLIEVTGRPS